MPLLLPLFFRPHPEATVQVVAVTFDDVFPMLLVVERGIWRRARMGERGVWQEKEVRYKEEG